MKNTKKFLSIILAILMIVTSVPFAFAAESDGVKTTLDVSDGKIVIADSYVTLGSKTVEVDPDGYILTGTARGDTLLEFINNSEEPKTFDLVFDNLSITANIWCSVIAIDDNSPVTLNIVCEGSNAISSYNHPVFDNDRASTSITINITKTEGSSITFKRQYKPEDGIVFIKDDTNTFVYINGIQVDAAVHCYDHKSVDGIQYCMGYLCVSCGQCFGEKDETNHYSDGVQTCCGYKCEICDVWYGEAGDEHIDEDGNAFCEGCDEFAGKEIKVGDTYTVTKKEYAKFVPTISGTYVLSSSGDSDPYVNLYDSNFGHIDSADDDDGYNFSFVYEYTAGETYYFCFKDYDDEYNYSVIFECKEHQGGEANCTDKAVCEVCGVAYGDIDADNHDIVVDEYVAPTCTETGLTEGSYCTRCEDATVAQEVIPALNHKDTLVQVEAKAPTCTEIGWDAYEYCTACDYTTYEEKGTVDHADEDNDGKCDNGGEQLTCEDCGRPVHEGLIQNVICWFVMLINLVKSMF